MGEEGFMNKLILYDFYNSVCCQKVRITLHAKGLEWQPINVDLLRPSIGSRRRSLLSSSIMSKDNGARPTSALVPITAISGPAS
jgi:hypothetical protein